MDFHLTSISQHFVGGLNPLAHPLNTALDMDISFPANDMGAVDHCRPSVLMMSSPESFDGHVPSARHSIESLVCRCSAVARR